uniref:BTB domain-containing protein n=1 Tax=Anopheles funestus TaxID=62324 RepID=A0A182R1Q7_ANOFN
MTSHQTLSLRWNDFPSHIASAFESLLYKEDLVDVTIYCEGRKIRAHKILLSACSSYFKDIFKENPSQHPIIIFKNVNYTDMYNLIKFMYKGEVQVPQESLASLLQTAKKLSVRGLSVPDVEEQKLPTTIQDPSTSMLAQKILQTHSRTMNNATITTDRVCFALPSEPIFSAHMKTESTVSQQLNNELLPIPTEDLTTALGSSAVPQAPQQEQQQQTTSTKKNPHQSTAATQTPTTDQEQHQHQQTNFLAQSSTELINVGDGLATTSSESNAYTQMDDFEMTCEDFANQFESEQPSNYEIEIVDMDSNNTCLDEDEEASTQTIQDLISLTTKKALKKKYKCNICFKSFVACKSLSMHIATHSGRTKCNICGLVLSRTANLKRHIRLKHEP